MDIQNVHLNCNFMLNEIRGQSTIRKIKWKSGFVSPDASRTVFER